MRHDSAADFLAHAQSWLSSAEAENNVPLGVARRLRTNETREDPPNYWATVQQSGAVVGCAFRTPPYLLALTRLPERAAALFADDLQTYYGRLPGVGGPFEEACEFAGKWSARSGAIWVVRTQMWIHELTSVRFPENLPAGNLEPVRDAEADLIRDWVSAFVRDASLPLDPKYFWEQLKDSPNVYLWHDREPRCMVAANRDTPNGSCVNAVYTPPEFRGRGYASAAVATLSSAILSRGKTFCCLYTDAANPISNSIYRKIGYRPIREDVDIDFVYD